MLNKEIYNLYGVSGQECDVSKYIENQIKPICDNIYKDSIGNLHAIKKANLNAEDEVLVVAYMDEPGVIITQITDDGYLKFETVGEVYDGFLTSKKVLINGIVGVISLKAIHLTTKEERKKPIKVSQLLIDIGAKSKEEVLNLIDIGDYGSFVSECMEFGDNFIKGRALGGRTSCFVAIELLKKKYSINMHIVFAVQKEVGNRGMMVAAYKNKSKFSIVLDGYDAGNGAENKEKNKYPILGNGCVVSLKCARDEVIKRLLFNLRNNNISYQIFKQEGIGQEDEIIKNGGNTKCFCLGIPIKYTHSTTQVAKIDDINSLIYVVSALIDEVSKEKI